MLPFLPLSLSVHFSPGLRSLVLDYNVQIKAAGVQEICNALLDDTWLVGPS